MRKLFMAALISGILFFMPAAEAEIETYIGEGSSTMSENETQDNAFERAKTKALRNAQEQAGVYIVSQSHMHDLELVEDDVKTITAAFVKVLKTDHKKTMSDDGVIQFFVTVTVQIDSEALQREIDRRLEKQRPKTPIDRPKPIEQPKPKPVEQPKPKPVEQPKPPIEQPKPKPPAPTVEPPKPPAPTVEPPKPPVEEPAPTIEPIKPPTPIEPVTPPVPVNEPSQPWLSDEQIMTSDLLELINAEREKAGKTPLKRNSVLVKGAKVRAEELTQKWSNKRPNGQGWWTVLPVSFQQKSSWEYIHNGYDTPQKIVDWYMSQADNKILSTNYTTIGIGYVYKADSDKKHYWVVILS